MWWWSNNNATPKEELSQFTLVEGDNKWSVIYNNDEINQNRALYWQVLRDVAKPFLEVVPHKDIEEELIAAKKLYDELHTDNPGDLSLVKITFIAKLTGLQEVYESIENYFEQNVHPNTWSFQNWLQTEMEEDYEVSQRTERIYSKYQAIYNIAEQAARNATFTDITMAF